MKIPTQTSQTVNTQQRIVLNALLLGTIIVCVLYTLINFHIGRVLLACIQILFVCIACIGLLLFRQTNVFKHFLYISFINLSLIYLLIIFVISRPITNISMYVWILIIPPLSYGFLGIRGGFLTTLVFTTFGLGVYYDVVVTYNKISGVSLYNLVICLYCFWVLVHMYEIKHRKTQYMLEASGLIDSLTELYNRRACNKLFEKYASIDCITGVILDIDLFKNINDNYGHEAGDTALILFAQELGKYFNEFGYVIRMGGEEFCVMMPHISSAEAKKSTEEFLAILVTKEVSYKKDTFNLSFSAGVCQYPLECDNYSELLKIADDRLYKAKRLGRSRVVDN